MCYLEMLYYCFSKFDLIYSLYYCFSLFICRKIYIYIYIYKSDEKHTSYYVYKSKDILLKLNNFYKIIMIRSNIGISYL
jgi:hypothetical protein